MGLYTPVIPTYTWAGKPAAATTGTVIFVSNAGTKGSHWFYDGTRWKPVNGKCVLASLDALSSLIPNSDTVVFSYQMPAGVWQQFDRLRFTYTVQKSGAVDTGTCRYRIGTAGTTADTQINTSSELVMAAGNRLLGMIIDIRLETVTTALQLGANNANNANSGYSQLGSSAVVTAKTISDASANALYFTASLLSGGTTDTVAMRDAQLELIAKAN